MILKVTSIALVAVLVSTTVGFGEGGIPTEEEVIANAQTPVVDTDPRCVHMGAGYRYNADLDGCFMKVTNPVDLAGLVNMDGSPLLLDGDFPECTGKLPGEKASRPAMDPQQKFATVRVEIICGERPE